MDAQVDLPPDPRSAGRARQFIRTTLGQWRLTELDGDAELMVSELVTNALLYAQNAVTVQASLRDDGGGRWSLRVGVGQDSSGVPRVSSFSDLVTTGRGLGIVRGLASNHGVAVNGSGKTFWFELVAPAGWQA